MLAGAICIWLILKAYQAIKPSYWQGSYYPNGDTLIDLSSPVFRTKEQCLEWALQLKRERNNPNDDFECGKNCIREKGRLVSICDETTD